MRRSLALLASLAVTGCSAPPPAAPEARATTASVASEAIPFANGARVREAFELGCDAELARLRWDLFKNQAAVARYIKENNLVWHHVENSSKLQLIRHDIHTPGRGGIFHFGGVSTHE